jgi:hypothetical protein
VILDERQAWLLFVGLVAASMGVSLFCDADEYAGAVTGWRPDDGEDSSSRLTRYYRAAGAAFALGGGALAAAALASPEKVAGRFRLFAYDDAGRLAGGVIFVLAGTTLAALRLVSRPRPLPAGLAGEAGADSLRRRVSAAARWARAGLITLYGCFLFSRIGGLPR